MNCQILFSDHSTPKKQVGLSDYMLYRLNFVGGAQYRTCNSENLNQLCSHTDQLVLA